MQTFLPYPSFEETAKTLDARRLNNQMNEAKVILDNVLGLNLGWKNHPIVKMWNGYSNALKYYFNCMLVEWLKRGYRTKRIPFVIEGKIIMPSWIGNNDFHLSHQSNLLRKDEKYYSKFFKNIPKDLKYIWIY